MSPEQAFTEMANERNCQYSNDRSSGEQLVFREWLSKGRPVATYISTLLNAQITAIIHAANGTAAVIASCDWYKSPFSDNVVASSTQVSKNGQYEDFQSRVHEQATNMTSSPLHCVVKAPLG